MQQLFKSSPPDNCLYFVPANMNKNIRFGFAVEMFGSVTLLKAIAMMLLVRQRTGTNVIKNFTINKIAGITGMHAVTVRKRLHTLKDYGLVEYQGRSLVMRSLVSKHKNRNIRLANIAYEKVKDVERSLQALLVAIMQMRKEFAKRTIRNAHNSHDAKEVKAAQRVSRKYGWGQEYIEHGMGYQKIASTLHCCKATAVRIVKYAEKIHVLAKMKHFTRTYMPGVNCMSLRELGYTFTTRNYAYVVKANTYVLINSLCV